MVLTYIYISSCAQFSRIFYEVKDGGPGVYPRKNFFKPRPSYCGKRIPRLVIMLKPNNIPCTLFKTLHCHNFLFDYVFVKNASVR